MNYTTINTDAPSGARINTTVTLIQEDDEPFAAYLEVHANYPEYRELRTAELAAR